MNFRSYKVSPKSYLQEYSLKSDFCQVRILQMKDEEVDDNLPYTEDLEYYGPDYKLHLQPFKMDNLNSSEYLSEIHEKVIENIRHLPGAPSMQILSNNPEKLLIKW